MITVSSSQMRELERRASEEFNIPESVLMENAGCGTGDLILRLYPEAQKVLIFCGKGNNGGDGFVAARRLAENEKNVTVVLLAPAEELRGSTKTNYEKIFITGIQILSFRDFIQLRGPVANQDLSALIQSILASMPAVSDAGGYDLIVDAILGTGFHSETAGDYSKAIDWINKSQKPVVSVDIPSGLDADTGEIRGTAVRASVTAVMAYVKQGLVLGQGESICGQIQVIDIGLPKALVPNSLDTP